MDYTKEQKFESVNNSSTSVCCGTFYIKNQRKYEQCKKCNVCQKFIEYKKQKKANFEEVRFHYVDTFRKCELYKKDFNVSKQKKSIETPTKPERRGPVITSKVKLAAEAYYNLEKNFPELITYVTWSELFAVTIMDKIIRDMDKAMRTSKLYQKKIKFEYNKFFKKYIVYIGFVKSKCFVDGDESVLKNSVNAIYVEFFKFRSSIENFLNKFKIEDQNTMSYILLAMEVMSEVNKIHEENIYNIQLKEKNAVICDFMSPKSLIESLDCVISQITERFPTGEKIDLNKDINIVNGVRVMYNKIRNPDTVSEIILNVYNYHESRKQ